MGVGINTALKLEIGGVMGMTMEQVEKNKREILGFLSKKLATLAGAIETLTKGAEGIVPQISMPRPRLFEFCPGVVWPEVQKNEKKSCSRSSYSYVVVRDKTSLYLGGPSGREEIAETICNFCNWQPRKIAYAIKQIEAATYWARKRYAGLLRAAEEIVKQQAKWQEELQTAMVMSKLGEGG